MRTVFLRAYFDGEYVVLDNPYRLEPNARLLVTVLTDHEEREDWTYLSAQRLAAAFTEDEPEYPLTSLREINPGYVRR